MTRTERWHQGVDRTERERNDNPFDGHNAARHRKAHQTRNTANRPPSPFRPLHRRLSICVFIFLQPPKPRSQLTPWLYANRHRSPGPVINLLNYITRTRCPSVQPPPSHPPILSFPTNVLYPPLYTHPPKLAPSFQLVGLFAPTSPLCHRTLVMRGLLRNYVTKTK